MSVRPRPVTATVTKPRWMEMPDSKAIAHARRHSLGSTGSTASLVSVLDHDSYMSVPSDSEIEAPKIQLVRKRSPKKTKTSCKDIDRNNYNNSAGQNRKLKSDNTTEGDLSPWETWLIRKTQEERQRRQEENWKKKQEKAAKLEKELEKNSKELKAQQVRMEWLERKKQEEILIKKMEKQKLQKEKREKEWKERQTQEKSVEKFKHWIQEKREEERARKRAEKEKKRREEEEKMLKAEKAAQKFQEWVNEASKRPKSAPSSYGYMDGKLKGCPERRSHGYHDTAAYPKPGFYNPIPWQPIHVPRVKNEKPKRAKSKKYVWNPNKYF